MPLFRTTLALSLIVAFQLSFAQKQWNDLNTLQENKLEPHTNVIPYAAPAAIDQLAYYDSPWCRSLNGTWKFLYVDCPSDVPKKFYGRKYNVSEWKDISVPGNIELQGFGVPEYVNERNEFPANPPFVPEDFNPVGCYVRDFEVPDEWKGRRVVVKFGAVKSAMRLYVNGKYVGYSEDGKTPAEFDISKYVGNGSNRMALEVFRFSNGSYLECQDMWRMSGITRDVLLYCTPKSYISDYSVVASYGERGKASLSLTVYTQNAVGCNMLVSLKKDGEVVMSESSVVGKDGTVRIDKSLSNIKPWSEYAPNLYSLVINLEQPTPDGLSSFVGGKVGFRTLEFALGQLMLNRIPMTIRGVNRHEHSAFGGQYVTRAEMEEDIRLMKAAGINAVRTSHYPDDEYWYELCDRYGIYVMDEANNESHGQGYGQNSLAKKPEWADAMWYRINNMYMRDRNHPCVFAWSLGNECGQGVCLIDAYRKLKALDKTRPVCNERAEFGEYTDIVMTMYPSPKYLSGWAQDEMSKPSAERRPYIIAEYCHAMGNSLGGLQEYWDTINKYPSLQGGFIWDWIDQSFIMKGDKRVSSPNAMQSPKQSVNQPLWYALGGDLGELPGIKDDDAFCANGLVSSYRQPHAHYYEVSAVYGKPKNALAPQCNYKAPKFTLEYGFGDGRSDKRNVFRQDNLITLKASDCSVSIDTTNGFIASYKYNGREMVAAPIRYNFWRPPTLNDLVDRNGVKCWQGLDNLEARLVSISKVTPSSATLEYLLLSPDDGYLLLKEIIDLNTGGVLSINYVVTAESSYRTLPKLGVQLGLDHSFSQTKWQGNLFETYPDRRSSKSIGMHTKSTNDILGELHPVPQESGNREAEWVAFSSNNQSLIIFSSPDDFSFSVRNFDDSVLTHAKRIKDLTPAGHYVVSLDYLQSGLGTATCGPGVDDRFLIRGDRKYNYRFTMIPAKIDVNAVNSLKNNQSALTIDTVFTTHVAPGKSYIQKVRCNVKPDKKYYAKFPKNMTDCRKGVVGDWSEQWSGFCGQEKVVFTLTLDSLRTINELVTGICNAPGDWVVAPDRVTVDWSVDGEVWSSSLDASPINPVDNIQTDNRRLRYKADLAGVKTLYLRLTITHPAVLPQWHSYKGEKAWLMIDEIEVR